MKLSDIMGGAGLAGYAEIALILFLLAFAAVAVRTLRWSDRREIEYLRHLPLDDGDGAHHPGDPA